jgi:energy-coupling factor transporter ATP-binding protein EcfA2
MGVHALGDDVRRELERLRRELGRDLEEVRGLLPFAEIADEIAELERDIEAQLGRVRAAAVITLVGATGAGKSTLLNALVGRAIAREGESRPTTSAPVVYRPVDADVRRLLAGLPGEAPLVIDYEPDLGGPWREQILIDAPDINSIAAEHREVVRVLASRSDVLLVVAHRQSVSELASVSFVDAFAGRRGMLFVLNRADELTEDAREELLAKIRELAAERWHAPGASVIATSARLSRTQANVPGWDELCDRLYELVNEGILGRVRRHNAIGTAARLAERIEQRAGAALEALDELERAGPDGLARWRSAVETLVTERLALRRTQVRELLWSEAARRWDGPGGWALRAGGLASLGLGAGALLVRRNPLLAAGAAAGAFAADRARDFVRERALSDAGTLLPGATELESLYRESFAPARLAAARLAGSPESMGVPESARLSALALTATAAAWDELVERDLARAAERGSPFLLRWTIDLPVYAFAGWIVYRAAIGIVSTHVLGFDLLIDALILLLAWLFLGRTLVRALLALRCQGLLGAVRSRFADALESGTGEELTVLNDSVARKREALSRLRELEKHWRARIEG